MITRKIEKIVNILLEIAEGQTPIQRVRHTAAIIYKNRIIAIGQNRLKSHPFQALYGRNKSSIYLHAETAAIKNALKKMDVEELRHTTLITVRKKPNGKVGIAYPCEGCLRCIAEFGISRLIYSARDGSIVEL